MQPWQAKLIASILTLVLLLTIDSVCGLKIQWGLTKILGLRAQRARLLFLIWLFVLGSSFILTIRLMFSI